MAEHTILDAVLDNTQVPHQPLVLIVDSAVFSGLPLFKEALRRALNRPGPVVLVTALYDPADLGSNGAQIVNLAEVSSFDHEGLDVEESILSAYEQGAELFIDSIDIIADDHSPALALKLIRSLLKRIKGAKPPSRLTVLLPHTSHFLPSLFPPTLSPALTILHPYHPQLLSHLSKSYLMPIDSSPNFTTILDRARDRRLAEKLAYGGLDNVEVSSDGSKGAIVSILIRKATGGTKGISRALAAVSKSENGNLCVGPIDDLVSVHPIHVPNQGGASEVTTHVDLDLPFNLSLTDEQKKRRGEVPLPYAHQGEGVGMEYGEEEDDDEED